jgi:hypothetical protein
VVSEWIVLGQTGGAVIEGTVSDLVDNSPVRAADVIIHSMSGVIVGRTITDINGRYSIKDLARGSIVQLSYHCSGYLPYPGGPETVRLSNVRTRKDISSLYRDTPDQGYWGRWSKKTKIEVEAKNTDPQQRTLAYDIKWSKLGTIGFPATIQVLAAKQLVAASPADARSSRLESFASVDLDQLKQADANIRAAANGDAKVMKYSIPPDVAGTIAADELKAKFSHSSVAPDFHTDFHAVWGDAGQKALRDNLRKDK